MLAKDATFFALGIGFLFLAKLKHTLRGYTTPTPIADSDACAAYELRVAERYLSRLQERGLDVTGKNVLELGPGSGLDTGVHLLDAGAASYTGFDKNPLALEAYGRLKRARLRYCVDSDFDIARAFPDERFDLVLSNAAFEHFDDVHETLRQVYDILAPGGWLMAEIDLQTHTRWIRDKDPNNIYRYPRWLYRLFYFPGQPNRVRPGEYARLMHDWDSVDMQSANVWTETRRVDPAFRRDAHLDWLSFVLTANRPRSNEARSG
jgi:SAM-dependent methyltransferase